MAGAVQGATILLTGGSGFIGTHLAERLCADNQVILFDSFRRDSLVHVPQLRDHPNVRVVKGDILDAEAVRKATEGADIVLHLAAIAGVSSYYNESLNTLRVNLLGTVNMLDAAVAAGVKQVVDFSTSEIFGTNALDVDEDSSSSIGPLSDPRWVYAISKLAGEQFTMQYSRKYDLACSAVRPFNIYGPRQTGEGAVANFSAAAVAGRPLTVYNEGNALRAWCYVSDLADAVLAILGTPAAVGEVFNIGNPSEVETTIGLARRLQRLVPGTTVERKTVERVEIRARVPVIEKARRILGYEPKVDLDEGLTRTIAWFREQGGRS